MTTPTTARTQLRLNWQRYFPILAWLPGYQRMWLRADILAGLTVVALLIPEGMAYAELAGMPPEFAFYAAPAGLLLYAIFGSSRQLVVAVSSAIAIMSFSIVSRLAVPESGEWLTLTAGLAVLAGVVTVLAGVFKLGKIARFFSESILAGFIFGLALVISIKQLPKILGVESGGENFWERVVELIRHLPQAHLPTLIIGIACVALMLIIERRFHRIPAALITLIFGILVSVALNLPSYGVPTVGEIPAGLEAPQVPALALRQWLLLLPGAVGIALVAFAEAIGPARSFAAEHKNEIDEDQELIGLGAANLGAGLFQGFPIGSSLSKSAANNAAGARSQMSGMLAAALTMLVALFLTWMFEPLPEATLGAIVVIAVSGMFKVPQMRRMYRLSRTDFWLALVTLVGVLTFNESLAALGLGVVLALGVLVARASQSRLAVLGREPGRLTFTSLEVHPDNRRIPGMLVVRPEQGLYFANSAGLRQEIRQLAHDEPARVRWVLLDLELTNRIDLPTMDVLVELAGDLRSDGLTLLLARVHAEVREFLRRGGAEETLGAENIDAGGLRQAIFTYLAHEGEVSADLVDALEDGSRELDALVELALERADKAEAQRLRGLKRRGT